MSLTRSSTPRQSQAKLTLVRPATVRLPTCRRKYELAAEAKAAAAGQRVAAGKATDRVRALYQRQLVVPLADTAEVLEEYKAWEAGHGKVRECLGGGLGTACEWRGVGECMHVCGSGPWHASSIMQPGLVAQVPYGSPQDMT